MASERYELWKDGEFVCAQDIDPRKVESDLAAANAKVAELEDELTNAVRMRDSFEHANAKSSENLYRTCEEFDELEVKCERLEKELATVRGGYEYIVASRDADIAELTRERDELLYRVGVLEESTTALGECGTQQGAKITLLRNALKDMVEAFDPLKDNVNQWIFVQNAKDALASASGGGE